MHLFQIGSVKRNLNIEREEESLNSKRRDIDSLDSSLYAQNNSFSSSHAQHSFTSSSHDDVVHVAPNTNKCLHFTTSHDDTVPNTNECLDFNDTSPNLPTVGTNISDSDAETQMPDWFESDDIICTRECKSIGTQTLLTGESIFLNFEEPSFFYRDDLTVQTQTCRATYYFSEIFYESENGLL